MVKLIIAGATGTAGSEVLRQALLDPRVEAVTVLTRRPLPPHVAPSPHSPKLNVILHSDFTSYPPSLLSQLSSYTACIWALGRSGLGSTEEEHEEVTVDFLMAAAKAFATLEREENGEGRFVFCLLSGALVDQREDAWGLMAAKVKGKAERLLAALPSSSPDYASLAPFIFRPMTILPSHPVPDGSFLYRQPLLFLLVKTIARLVPSTSISSEELAKGMIEVVVNGGRGTLEGWEGKGEAGNEGTFGNEEIKRLARGEKAVA